MKLLDNFNRVHDYVRISLIDKCNLKCIYCNPSNSFAKLFESNKSILSYEELYRLINILVKDLEIRKIRFTGGEPLIRKDVMKFFEMIYPLKNKYDFEIGITTNGTNLLDKLERLKSFGVEGMNISLDTLNKTRFIAITGSDYFDETISSIYKAMEIGFESVKINVVIIKDVNDDELTSFIDYFKSYPVTVRFIEYMPFAGNQWDDAKFLGWREMKRLIEEKYILKEIPSDGKISKDFFVENAKLKVGFISSISDHFCDSCNRLRITASGQIKNCLFAKPLQVKLKAMLSDTSTADKGIAEFLIHSLQTKWMRHPKVYELSRLNQNNMVSIGG